jgi:hypothetical protein
MNVQISVNAGVCGFITKATARCEDGQFVDTRSSQGLLCGLRCPCSVI